MIISQLFESFLNLHEINEKETMIQLIEKIKNIGEKLIIQ